MNEQKKVVVYMPKKDYVALRIKLLEQGKTVSGWVREVIKRFMLKA